MNKLARFILAFKKYKQYKRIEKRLKKQLISYAQNFLWWEVQNTILRQARVEKVCKDLKKIEFPILKTNYNLFETMLIAIGATLVFKLLERLV